MVKSVLLVASPAGLFTVILPLVAPSGTVVATEVADFEAISAVVPLNFTSVTSARLVPVIVTASPTSASAGLKDAMVGFGASSSLQEVVNAVSSAIIVMAMYDRTGLPCKSLFIVCIWVVV